MVLLNIVEGVRQFSIYNNEEVVVSNNKIRIGDRFLDALENDDYYVQNDILCLSRDIDGSDVLLIYDNDSFVKSHFKYSNRLTFFSKNEVYSHSYNTVDGKDSISFIYDGEEHNYEFVFKHRPLIPHYDSHSSILMIPLFDEKTLVFYSKTGQKLWEYHEEDDNLKINAGCMPVVDDVVVVISEECVVPQVIRGFNIHTGKKLWERIDVEDICPHTLFLGPDNMLYGCFSDAESPLESSNLFLTKLNPLTGDIEVTKVAGGEWFDVMPWLVTMHGNKLYYTDNRRGNEIGVIDVEKKELVERMPLNINQKVTIGAPFVTDDKVYVFIEDLQELRVFEK